MRIRLRERRLSVKKMFDLHSHRRIWFSRSEGSASHGCAAEREGG